MPLKELLRARFSSALQSIPPGTWKILITDNHSQALLDTVYSNYDILQQNVTSVEPLHSPRGPMSVDAIYLLTPTSQNVDRIIADFAGTRQTYRSAHLFFVDGIDDRLATKLTDALAPQGVLKAFVELYCNLWAVEDRVFSLKSPSSFFSMFGTPGGAAAADIAMEQFQDDLKVTGRSILNVLTTINENPYIRYYQPMHHPPLGPLSATASSSSQQQHQLQQQQQQQQGASLRWRSAMGGSGRVAEVQGDYLCKKIAVQVQNDLDEYMANNPEFPQSSGRPRGTLFIVDRSMDPVAPFLHEFWYQAMANDLLKIDDGVKYRYTYENTVGAKEEKDAILSEADAVWVSVRHLHMKDAIDQLMTDFSKFAADHAGFRGNPGTVQISDLKDMLASLPQFQAQREQFSLHLDMAQECMGMFEKKRLNLAANVEQCCATGYTSDGKTPKTLVEEMVPLLDDRNMSSLDKVRIIALYILFRDGVADEDRRRLYQHARLSITEQDMINNLVHLGVKVIKDSKDRNKATRIKQKYVQREGEFELSRYKPVVQIVLEDHHSNRLDQHQFPFMRDTPPELTTSLRGSGGSQGSLTPAPPSSSLRSARPTWHKAPSARQNSNFEGRQRFIIFVAGGVTYAEMRQAYVLSQALGKDIFIGSTHIITPESFLRDMKALGRGGIGGHAPNAPERHPQAPNPPSRNPGQPMPYQKIIDYRHWQPPVGPPPLAPPAPAGLPAPGQGRTNSFNVALKGMSDLSLASKDSKSSLGKKDSDKKKGLFKMKWGKD